MNTIIITNNNLINKGILNALNKYNIKCKHFTLDYVLSKDPNYFHQSILIYLNNNHPNGQGAFLSLIKKYNKSTIIPIDNQRSYENLVFYYHNNIKDYFYMPINYIELAGRIFDIYFKSQRRNSIEILRYQDISLNLKKLICHYKDKNIHLTCLEMRLLQYLMHNAEKVINKQDIISFVWDENKDLFSNSIDVYFYKLRKKLDPEKKYFHTIHSKGYYFGERPKIDL